MNKNIFSKTPVVCALAMICCLLWGSAFPCIKIGYKIMNIASNDTASQLLFAGVRFTLAGLLVILSGSMIKKRFIVPKRESIPNIIKLSAVQTVIQYVLFYIGLANTTGVKSSIIEASSVFTAIFLSVYLFKYERMTAAKIIGCIVGLVGVAIINIPSGGMDMSLTMAGEGAIFLSATSYAFSSGMIKKYSKTEDTLVLSGYQFTLGGIVLAIAGAAMGGTLGALTAQSLLLILYMAFVSAAAYSLWGILLAHNEVGKVAAFGFMNPVFGVILSSLLLRESMSGAAGAVSLVLVCIGIYLVNKAPKKI